MTNVTSGSTTSTARFRSTLGQFATGVVVISTIDDDGRPHGFACQSFASLSLDPPLVLFCASLHSRAWAVMSRTGRFAVSVLSEFQRDVSAVFGSKADDKFARVAWTQVPGSGNPVLVGSLAWVDAEVEGVYPGGDHEIVTGRVRAVSGEGADVQRPPLLFHRGRYSTSVSSLLG